MILILGNSFLKGFLDNIMVEKRVDDSGIKQVSSSINSSEIRHVTCFRYVGEGKPW